MPVPTKLVNAQKQRLGRLKYKSHISTSLL